jgi:hypothetical protein
LPTFLAPLVILSAAALAILVILYRIYETRVEQPKKLEDEVKEALAGAKPEVESIEPVRKAALAISYAANKIVIIRDFGRKPTRLYTVNDLIGIEVFVNDKIVARVLRSGPHKMFDDIAPEVHRVTIRLVFDDPSHPDYELVLWDPHDALTARAEGPRAAMETARKWFYHVEAILRRPQPREIKPVPTSPPPVPEPAKVVAVAEASPPALPPAPPAMPLPKVEGDVLNAPLIPYI